MQSKNQNAQILGIILVARLGPPPQRAGAYGRFSWSFVFANREVSRQRDPRLDCVTIRLDREAQSGQSSQAASAYRGRCSDMLIISQFLRYVSVPPKSRTSAGTSEASAASRREKLRFIQFCRRGLVLRTVFPSTRGPVKFVYSLSTTKNRSYGIDFRKPASSLQRGPEHLPLWFSRRSGQFVFSSKMCGGF